MRRALAPLVGAQLRRSRDECAGGSVPAPLSGAYASLLMAATMRAPTPIRPPTTAITASNGSAAATHGGTDFGGDLGGGDFGGGGVRGGFCPPDAPAPDGAGP